MSIVQTIGRYDDEFCERVKELAMSQLTPSMIADRLELQGNIRKVFLHDISNPLHAVGAAFRLGLGAGYQDIMDSLHSGAVAGDPDCAIVLLKAQEDQKIADLKKELFGV